MHNLELNGGKLLEVSVGPGVNLPYPVTCPDVSEVFGLDLTLGQLIQCQCFVAKKGRGVDLLFGNCEQLPFQTELFVGVFHVGRINFFTDKKAAILEMIHVAQPGTRLLIADEKEKTQWVMKSSSPVSKNHLTASASRSRRRLTLCLQKCLKPACSRTGTAGWIVLNSGNRRRYP